MVVGAPPPYSVNCHPLPRPQTRVGGGFLLSFLPPPMPPCATPLPVDALTLHAASAPPPAPHACTLCVNTPPPVLCHAPCLCVDAPGLYAASMPPACALRQRPWPVRHVNAPWPARRVNAPGLHAASTPPACVLHQPPLPLRCAPASALTPPLGALCQCPLLCKRRVCSLGFPPPLL